MAHSWYCVWDIKSNHLLGHKCTTLILIKMTEQLYIYFVAGELQDG